MDLFVQDLRGYPQEDIRLLGDQYKLQGDYEDLLSQIAEIHLQQWRRGEMGTEVLSLAETGLDAVPESIFQLPNLRILDLSNNQLTVLPERFGNLTTLEELILDGNQLTLLPESMVSWRRLKKLSVTGNKLMTTPNLSSTGLIELTLTWNNLSYISDWFCHLSTLTHLALGINPFEFLPRNLGNLQRLEKLEISDCPNLHTLPSSLLQIPNLQIDCFQTTIKIPQSEIAAFRKILVECDPIEVLKIGGNTVNLDDEEVLLTESHIDVFPTELYRFPRLKKLSLTGNNLTIIPESIGQLTTLEEFRFSDNQIKELPSSFCELTSLKILYVNENGLVKFPECINRLIHLEFLSIGDNQLTVLPESIGDLSKLQTLNAYGNLLVSLPESIGSLTKLTGLHLTRNELTVLPESIGNLDKLLDLAASHNKLSSLPVSFDRLKLIGLSLGNNRLTSLPEVIGKITTLAYLYIFQNPFESLPENLGNLVRLTQLGISNCPNLHTLPSSLLNIPHLKIECEQTRLIFPPSEREAFQKKLLNCVAEEPIDPLSVDEIPSAERTPFNKEPCTNSDSLYGDDLSQYQNFEIASYVQQGVTFCFSVEELIDGEITNNPYTQTPFPADFMKDVQEKYAILRRLHQGGWKSSVATQEPEQEQTPEQKARDILLQMSRAGYLPDIDRIQNMTISQQNDWLRLMVEYGINMVPPSPEVTPINHLLSILQRLSPEQYPTAILVLEEIL